MKKFLLVATVVKTHVNTFHIPTLKMMKEKGYEVHVASHNDYDDPADMYIPHCDKFIEIPFERSPLKLNNIKSYQKLKELFKKENYDIIHCHTPVGGALTRLAARDTRKNGTKVLYTAHGFHFYKGAPLKNWLLYYPIEKLLSRYTDTLITINKEDFNRAKTFDAKEVKYVPGVGVKLEEFRKKDLDIKVKKYELNLKQDSFIILSIGELSKRKNHEVAIKAIAKLNNKEIMYLICGQGELKGYLMNLADNLGVGNQVMFLGFRNDIDELCEISDIFLFPSLQEGLPVSIMEAMASGLPVIASDIRGNGDLIDDDKGGFLCGTNNVDEYAEKIQNMIDNPGKISEFSSYNLKKIQDYSIDEIEKDMTQIYFGI